MRKSVASRGELGATSATRTLSAVRVGSGVWLEEQAKEVTDTRATSAERFIADDVSGASPTRSMRERGDRRSARWVTSLALTLVLGVACSKSDTSDTTDPSADVSSERTPTLAEVRVTELTPRPLRDQTLSPELQALAEAAFFTSFHKDLKDPTACRAQVTIGYAMVVNGRPVPAAEEGEAHALFEGEVFCPDTSGRPTEGFRLELATERPFGPSHGITGPARVREVVTEILREGSDALFGQVQIRAASDDQIRTALRSSQHPGILAEAASEAGERRLVDTGDALVALTRHANRRVAARAGAALGLLKLDTPETIKALVALTEGPDTEKHLVAIHALGDIGSADAKRYLEVIAVGHPNPLIRQLARERLGRPREPSPDPVPEPVPDPTPAP